MCVKNMNKEDDGLREITGTQLTNSGYLMNHIRKYEQTNQDVLYLGHSFQYTALQCLP